MPSRAFCQPQIAEEITAISMIKPVRVRAVSAGQNRVASVTAVVACSAALRMIWAYGAQRP